MKIYKETYEYYMQDTIDRLKEEFDDTIQEVEDKIKKSDYQGVMFSFGLHDAMYNVLQTLRNQAIIFDLPLEKIKLKDPYGQEVHSQLKARLAPHIQQDLIHKIWTKNINITDGMLYNKFKENKTIDKKTYEYYLLSNVYLFKEKFNNAVYLESLQQEKGEEQGTILSCGHRHGLYCALETLRNMAIVFALPLKKIGLKDEVPV